MFGSSCIARPDLVVFAGGDLGSEQQVGIVSFCDRSTKQQRDDPGARRDEAEGRVRCFSCRSPREQQRSPMAIWRPPYMARTSVPATGLDRCVHIPVAGDDVTGPRLGFDQVAQVPGEPTQEFASGMFSVSLPCRATFIGPSFEDAPRRTLRQRAGLVWVGLIPAACRGSRRRRGQDRRRGSARGSSAIRVTTEATTRTVRTGKCARTRCGAWIDDDQGLPI